MVVRDQDLFWAERTGVFRVNLATGRRDEILHANSSQFAIAGDRLIWKASEGPSIFIANFGSHQSAVISEGSGALIADEREIYLVGDPVRVLTPDGTEGRTFAPGTKCDPAAALDARWVYCPSKGRLVAIDRASESVTTLAELQQYAVVTQIGVAGEHVYWTEFTEAGRTLLRRVPMRGGAPELLDGDVGGGVFVSPDAIVWAQRPGKDGKESIIRMLRPSDTKPRELPPPDGILVGGVAVARYPGTKQLMLILSLIEGLVSVPIQERD